MGPYPRFVPGHGLESLGNPMADVVLPGRTRKRKASGRHPEKPARPVWIRWIRVFSNTAAKPAAMPTTTLSSSSLLRSDILDSRGMTLNFGIFVQI